MASGPEYQIRQSTVGKYSTGSDHALDIRQILALLYSDLSGREIDVFDKTGVSFHSNIHGGARQTDVDQKVLFLDWDRCYVMRQGAYNLP